MTGGERIGWQAAAVAWVVLPMAVLGGGRYPLAVDLSVYIACGLAAWWAAGYVILRREAKRKDRAGDT